MTPLDPSKSLQQLLEMDKGVTDQDQNPEPPVSTDFSEQEFLKFISEEPENREMDISKGEFNKSLVVNNEGKVAVFSNPPRPEEMASTDIEAPFLPKPKLQEEKSLSELLYQDKMGIPDTEPVSAEILPEDAKLQLQAFTPQDKPKDTPNPSVTDLSAAAMRGFYSVATGMADAYGASVSALGYVTQGKPYPLENTLGYQLARSYEKNVAATFPETEAQQGLAGQVAGAMGQSAGIMLTTPIGGPNLGVVGQTVKAATTGAIISGGASVAEAFQSGASTEQALANSGLNALIGTSEAVPLGKWLNKLDNASGGAFSSGLKGFFKDVAIEGTEEFSQETFQTWASNWFKKYGYKPDQELEEGLWESAQVGGISGVLASTLINLLGVRRIRRPSGQGLNAEPKPSITNAPLTSEAQSEAPLEQDLKAGLQPMTEYVRPEQEIFEGDEPIDLGSLLPKEETTSGQEPSAAQEEETQPTTEPQKENLAGENLQPGVTEQGETAGTPSLEKISGTPRIQEELNFKRRGRPSKPFKEVEKVAKQLELNFQKAGRLKPYTTSVPENNLGQLNLFDKYSAAPSPKLEPTLQRSVDYAAEYYISKLRPEFEESGRISDASRLFPDDLSYAELADKIIPIIKQAELAWPENEQDQVLYVRALKNRLAAMWEPPKGRAIQEAKDNAGGEPPEPTPDVLPTNVSDALVNLNARLGRLQQNRPEPVKRLPKVKQPGSRVSGELILNEERPEYLEGINSLAETPDETANLSEAETYFRDSANRLKKNNPNMSFDETRLAGAARLRYWRQLRKKYDLRKNRTEGVTQKEADEIFQTQDVPGLSKQRIFRSVVEDYSRKLGRRLGGKIGMEAAQSMQRGIGEDDGTGLLEDVMPSQQQTLNDNDVRSDLLKNAKNAYFNSLGEDPAKKYLLGAALDEAARKGGDPKALAKNTTRLSEIAGTLNASGFKTTTGELAKNLPKLVDDMISFVTQKRDADFEQYQKTGQLPEMEQGPQKVFKVLSQGKGSTKLTEYDRQAQALARDLLDELDEQGFLTSVEVANIQDKLDLSPRQGAAVRAIQEMQAILASKQPGVGLTEPVLKTVSGANPDTVQAYVPARYNLLPHQRQGANLIINAFKAGRGAALLADDAGLGKGRTFLSAARTIADMKAQTRGEPYGKVIVITESNELIDSAMGGLRSQLASANIPRNRVYFYTYDAYSKNSIPDMDNADVIVFDESQNLKNTSAIRNQMARQAAAFKIFSTATPADKLSGVLYFLPGILGQSETTVRSMLEISKDKAQTVANLAESAATVGAYIRRIPDAPRPTVGRIELEAGDQIRAQVDTIETYYRKQITELTGDPSAVPTLEQQRKSLELEGVIKFKTEAWAELNKAPYIFESAMQDLNAGKQVIIFGEFVSDVSFPEIGVGKTQAMLETLNNMFRSNGIMPAVVYGEGGSQMTSDINDFQSGSKRVALVTPIKGGAGLSLDDQTGTSPRVVYIATPNEAADKHDQILHRGGFRISSRSIPEIKELVATDIWTDLERIKRREAKQQILEATQGITKDEETGQLALPFTESSRIDRNTQPELTKPNLPLYAEDKQNNIRREATVVRNGQMVDSRFSSLSPYEQDIVDSFAQAMTDLKFKNVKIIFGDRGGLSAWTPWQSADFNTVYINPEQLLYSRDLVGRNFRGRLDNAGRGYLLGVASEEQVHNATYAIVRAVAVKIYNDQIRNGEITAQEAYVKTMNHVLKKTYDEISPEAKELLRRKYGEDLNEQQTAIEYLRYVFQKAKLGYSTESFSAPSEETDNELRTMLKNAPKDGYISFWFKAIRQAIFDLLGKLGLTIQKSPMLGTMLDGIDNVLFQLERYGPNGPPINDAAIEKLLKLASPETYGKLTMSDGLQTIQAEAVDLSEINREIEHSSKLKAKPANKILEFGDSQRVRDAFGREHLFRYAWVDRDLVQASHLGSDKFFASNPKYTGVNQRNYAYNPQQKEKILRIQGPEFNARQIVNDGAGASNQGLPILAFDKAAGAWMVVAGNGREQVTGQVLRDTARREEMLGLASELAARYGGAIPENVESGRWFLYRVLEEQLDTSTPEGVSRLNTLVKETNAEGGSELTHIDKAEVDSKNIFESATSAKALSKIALEIPELTRATAQTFLGKLANQKIINKDERNALFSESAGTMPVEYVQYLVLRKFLQPLERYTNVPNVIPEYEMAKEVMDQGKTKNLYLLMAQASAASEVLGEETAAKYRAFFSRIANQMIGQKATGNHPLAAIKDMATGVMDLLNEEGAIQNKYPEIEADPEFKKLIDFISEKLGPTTKLSEGRTKYTAKSQTVFNVILDEVASSLSENAQQGNAEDIFSVSPIQKAIESSEYRIKKAQSSNEELEAKEFLSGTGPVRTREQVEAELREARRSLAQAEYEMAQDAAEKETARIQKPVEVFGQEVYEEEPEYASLAYDNPYSGVDDEEFYEGMDVNAAESESAINEYASNFEHLAAKRGFYGRVEGFQLTSELIEKFGPNLADLSVFDSPEITDDEVRNRGFKSRTEYNKLLSALDQAGMGNYFKLKKLLEAISRDEEWLNDVIERAKEEGALKKFFAEAKELMEPANQTVAVNDKVIERLFAPFRRAVEVTKTTQRIMSYEDEAVKRLVQANQHTKEMLRFLNAIGDQEKTRELKLLAEQANAAYEQWSRENVSIQDLTSTDADWDIEKKKWVTKKERMDVPPAPLDKAYRKRLANVIKEIEERSRVVGTLTPSIPKRVAQTRLAVLNANANIRMLDQKILQINQEILAETQADGLETSARTGVSFKKRGALVEERRRAVAIKLEAEEMLERMMKTDHVNAINVKDSSKGRKLSDQEVENLSPRIVSELRRRGLIPEFGEGAPLYKKTIEWTFPANYIGLGNREPRKISAEVIYQDTKAKDWTKTEDGQWQLPVVYGGVGMIVKYNTDKNLVGDFRTPFFTDGGIVPQLHAEYAASAYYNQPNALGITRNSGTDSPTLRTALPVQPDLSAIRRVEAKQNQETEVKKPAVIVGMRPKGEAIIKTEPSVDERGNSMWEFQLNPELPDFSTSKLATTPTKMWKGKQYGGDKQAKYALNNINTRSRKIYIRARTADEAVILAVQQLGERGDIYYKGKWYGKAVATKTKKVDYDKLEEKESVSQSQIEVRKALRKNRMDLLLQAIEEGRATNASFDFAVKREAEAYLTSRFESGVSIDDPDVTKIGMLFGWATLQQGKINKQGLKRIQQLALTRMTPKSMATVNRSKKVSATGPMRNVSENFLFAGKKPQLEVAVEESEFTVPSGRQRTSDEVLADLAAQNGVSVEDLKKANNLTMGKVIVGSQLLIPGTTKSVEVPQFFEEPEQLTALEIATRNGVTKAEMLAYNRLPADYVPKPGDVLKFPASGKENNLMELAFKIIKTRAHVTYPQMLYKDRAPQGVQLVDRNGEVAGASSVRYYDGADDRGRQRHLTTPFMRVKAWNAAGNAEPTDFVDSVEKIVSDALAKGKSSAEVSVVVDHVNGRVTISDNNEGMTPEELEQYVLGRYQEGEPEKRLDALSSVLATSGVEISTVKDGILTTVSLTPERLLKEGEQINMYSFGEYGDETGIQKGTKIVIQPRTSINLPGGYLKVNPFYMPSAMELELLPKSKSQKLILSEIGLTAKTKVDLAKAKKLKANEKNFIEGEKEKVMPFREKKEELPKTYNSYVLMIDGVVVGRPTTSVSIAGATGNFAVQLIKDKIPYNGKKWKMQDVRLLIHELKINNRVSVQRMYPSDDISAASVPRELEERQARAIKDAKKEEGRQKRQQFAGQIAADERLGPEIKSASALRDFKYSVRTQPLRAGEMVELINRVGGAENAATAILSPDIEVRDDELQAIRDGNTNHFDNTVILNSILIQQLEKAARENPERGNEIRAMQFALAKKQADLGTSLAQGLRAFGAYTRIGAAGWLWFAGNTKQVERLRQVGLFAGDIEKAKLAGEEGIRKAVDKVFGQPEIEKLSTLIDQTANNAVWAQLLLKAKGIATLASQWQKMSTNTLSDVLEQQVKTAKEMIALLKEAEPSVEKQRQMSTTIAEGTAALLQKGVASAEEAGKELGVSKEEVLKNIEQAQDVLDENQQATTYDIQNHLWKRFGNTMLVDNEDDTVSGAPSPKPSKEVNRAGAKIIENVLEGFIANFEKALNAKDGDNSLPKETAVGVIRRILRERVQLQADGQLKLTRSKMSQEQRKLLSVRRFREAMNQWESLQNAVDLIYEQMNDSMDEGSYQKIVEAMQLAMDEPFTTADVRAFMTLPYFNFKEFIFNKRYLLTARKAEVLSDLVQELRASGVEVNNDVLGRVLSKVSDEMENIAQKEIEKSISRIFGKTENKVTKAVRENIHSVAKAALANNLSEKDIYGFIAKKLKLEDTDWLPSRETQETISKLAEEIANDPDGPDSRRAGKKTLDILDAVKKDAGVTVTEAMIGQFYTNILQGVKTITVNLLSPIGNTLNLGTVLASRTIKDKNLTAIRSVMRAVPRALNNALVEAVDLLATGDSSGKTLAPGKTLSTRVSGRPLPELLAEGGVRINANSSFGKGVAKLAELWFGWNKKGVWPKIAVPKGIWDKTFKIVRGGLKKAGAGTVRAPEYPGNTPMIQVSPTGLGVLVSRLYNALDLGATTFYSEVLSALAASDVSKELMLSNPDRDVPNPDKLLSSDLASMLRTARAIAGRNEKLPHGMEGPEIVRKMEKQAEADRVERLKPGTLDFRQQLYLSARRNRGLTNPYWNQVWNKGSKAERAEIDRLVGSITDDAFFLGSVMAYTNKPTGVLGKLAKTIEGWSNEHLLAKLVQPFYGIVTSVYQTWLNWLGGGVIKSFSKDITVFGEGKRKKPSDMVAMELGSGIMGLSMLAAGIAAIVSRMISDGDDDKEEHFLDFSGRGPSDPAFRQALIDSGKWQPDSIKIGNMWFRNPNWLPTYLVFKALGYMRDYSKYEKPNQAKASELAMQFTLAGVKSMGVGVLDVPFLSGAKSLADLANVSSPTWDQKALSFVLRTGGSVLFGNLLREADRKIFPEKTDNLGDVHSLSGLMAMGLGNIPFLRNFNKPMTNVLGEPMLSDGSELPKDGGWDRAKTAFFNYGDIVLRYRDNPDPLWSELAKKKAWITLPDRMVRVRGVVLNDEQRDDWVMERARVLRETVRDTAWVKELPNRTSGDVQNEISKLTARANKSADVLVLNKYELWDKVSDIKQQKRELGPRNVD